MNDTLSRSRAKMGLPKSHGATGQRGTKVDGETEMAAWWVGLELATFERGGDPRRKNNSKMRNPIPRRVRLAGLALRLRPPVVPCGFRSISLAAVSFRLGCLRPNAVSCCRAVVSRRHPCESESAAFLRFCVSADSVGHGGCCKAESILNAIV